MRFEVVNRQRFKHAVLVAQFVFALSAYGQAKPALLVIGHPTSHTWKPQEHPAFAETIIDRDLHPRVADAYTKFAKIVGAEGDPLYVIVTPHWEPVAAIGGVTPEQVKRFLDVAAARDRDRLVAEAGLAVRRFLLAQKEEQVLEEIDLRDLAKSARYDHMGGGFFRGTRGSIPYFDKSLADQARYAIRFIDAWQETRDPLFADVARATLDYMLSELQDKSGAFVAGQHADSLVPRGGPELLEGGHYVWQAQEIRHLLGPKLGAIVIFHYGVKDEGNVPKQYDRVGDFYRKNVLVPRPDAETRAKFSLNEQELADALRTARQKLLEVRSKRPDPRWHSPIITAYNGAAISALARAAVAFDEPRYANAAVRAARALHPKTLTPGDRAMLTRGLFDAYEATFDVSLIERATALPPPVSEEVPEPVAALAPNDDDRAPSLDSYKQVIIAGDRSREDTKALIRAIRESRAPNRMIFLIDSERARARLAQWMPYVKDVAPIEKQAVATVCELRTCRTPTTDPATVVAWLDRP